MTSYVRQISLINLLFLVPVVDIDAHALGEEVVEYVYPVKDPK